MRIFTARALLTIVSLLRLVLLCIYCRGVIHSEFLPDGEMISKKYYSSVMTGRSVCILLQMGPILKATK